MPATLEMVEMLAIAFYDSVKTLTILVTNRPPVALSNTPRASHIASGQVTDLPPFIRPPGAC